MKVILFYRNLPASKMGNTLTSPILIVEEIPESGWLSTSSEEGDGSSYTSTLSPMEEHGPLNFIAATTATDRQKEKKTNNGCLPSLPLFSSLKRESIILGDDEPDQEQSAIPPTLRKILSSSSSFCNKLPSPHALDGDGLEEDYFFDSLEEEIITPAELVTCGKFSNYPTPPRTNKFEYTQEELMVEDGESPTEESSLSKPRNYWIVTTAALPWMTGTAVNPLLRAAYLNQRNRKLYNMQASVTLALPWLDCSKDRVLLYGKDWEDATPQKQEMYIRDWLKNQAEMPNEAALPEDGGIQIQWYPAKYHPAMLSIFALGDLCDNLPENTSNTICILEEPEHVNWYRAPDRVSWRERFPHVIGIAHTNYKAYAKSTYGVLLESIVGFASSAVVSPNCDKVIKLSPVLQTYDSIKDVVCNVHGIRSEFFTSPISPNANKIYFIGKLLWAKGLDKLLDLQSSFKKHSGSYFEMDIIGSGPEEAAIQQAYLGKMYNMGGNISAHSSLPPKNNKNSNTDKQSNPKTALTYWRRFKQPIPATFCGRKDHAKLGPDYKIFVNPSITEVLCTTTAEAIAMGKWVIIPKHASNEFFLTFPNCLQYSTKLEFVALLQHAMQHDPPITENREEAFQDLTWEAAIDRLVACASLSKREAMRRDRLALKQRDHSHQNLQYVFLGKESRSGDFIRKVMGGGPVAEQSKYSSFSSSNSLTSLTQLEEVPAATA